jgi:Ca2+-binding RTX toxin-like protein
VLALYDAGTMRGSRLAPVIAAAMVTMAIPSMAPAGTTEPTCFGRPITIFAEDVYGPVEGTSGDDVIWGETDGDYIRGRRGNDRICARGGDDIVYGGRGNDRVSLGGSGGELESVQGGPGHDRLFGNRGPDHLTGGAGNDYLHGGPGSDWGLGEEGDDVCVSIRTLGCGD